MMLVVLLQLCFCLANDTAINLSPAINLLGYTNIRLPTSLNERLGKIQSISTYCNATQ
jgi:hypothetical protein